MKRRQFFQAAGVGSAALAALSTSGRAHGAVRTAAQHSHSPISGPQATATVSFGAWMPGSRFPNLGAAPMLPNNAHVLIPNEVQIKAGGTVNFIVAGFHQIVIYGNGKRPGDVDTSLTVDVTSPPGAPLIDDPEDRFYRGIDPTVLPTLGGPPQGPAQPKLHDRVEVVYFPNRGRYLVICAVLPHFEDEMWGWVNVNP
jgi:plastocyanin